MGPPDARRDARVAATGLPDEANVLAGGGGFEPPLRGPEPRVLPLDDPPPTGPHDTTARPRAPVQRSPDGRLQRPARAKPRHARGWDLDLLARPRVAAIASGTASDDKGAEAADGHPAATTKGLHHAGDERGKRTFGGGFRTPRGLGEEGNQVGL